MLYSPQQLAGSREVSASAIASSSFSCPMRTFGLSNIDTAEDCPWVGSMKREVHPMSFTVAQNILYSRSFRSGPP